MLLEEDLQKQITLIDKALDAKGKANERVVLLRTIPGVGPRRRLRWLRPTWTIRTGLPTPARSRRTLVWCRGGFPVGHDRP